MPPKKRVATKTATKSAPAVKRAKGKQVKAELEETAEAEEESTTVTDEPVIKEEPKCKNDIITKLREADKKNHKIKIHKPDKDANLSDQYRVHLDYDCTLNQTNIGFNNNKFYIIQILELNGQYFMWNRWGRVGEIGSNNGLEHFNDVNGAIKSFEKKFKDKTKNDWNKRENFVVHTGKYTLIETEEVEEGEGGENSISIPKEIESSEFHPSKLDPQTQELVQLIFDTDMFKSALKKFDIDVKKMPLGKLSKTQIAKGFEVLEEIETLLKKSKPSTAQLENLSSKFYTVIPQSFGRGRPPAIKDQEMLQEKYDMLTVLGDIELAQTLQEGKKIIKDEKKQPNPIDQNYELLKTKLTLLDKTSDEFQKIKKYTEATKQQHIEIMDVWKVERENENLRFEVHNSIENRKLLWHGTNVAVVVAILKTGLRIMPHSGGRVGRGIYFASENGKSAGYVNSAFFKNQNIGIMFLNEVALGKESYITSDDSSLTKPPSGYDSIIARGRTEPDPSKDTHLIIDNKKVIVPQGKPINQGINSSFYQSEYLIYQESQNRIRYLLKMKF